MLNVGRVCVKISGREAGEKCAIVEVVDNNYVIIDGNVRRKKCNMSHLEPLPETVEIESGAPHEKIVEEFSRLGIYKEKSKVKRTKKETAPAPEKATPKKEAKSDK